MIPRRFDLRCTAMRRVSYPRYACCGGRCKFRRQTYGDRKQQQDAEETEHAAGEATASFAKRLIRGEIEI